MEVTRELVRKTAELARLELTEAEEQQMQQDLQQILSYMECLGENDPAQPSEDLTVHLEQLRSDEVSPSMPEEQLLEVSPSKQGFWTPEEG